MSYNYFIVGAIDSFARGLRNAVELANQGVMAKCVQVNQRCNVHMEECIIVEIYVAGALCII